MTAPTRQVVIIGYDQCELLDIACVSDTLDAANRLGADPGYRIRLASAQARPVRSAGGLALVSQAAVEKLRGPLDTLVIAGGPGHLDAAADPSLLEQVRRLAPMSRRVASVCTGASVLAAAGLLDGRRATTHWAYARKLADRHPEVTVDPRPLYVIDGEVCTSAGVTSALDLTLALVEDDHGPDLARSVARWLVTYMQRPGNQAQLSPYVKDAPPAHRLLRQVVRYITSHLDADLSTAALAARNDVSERHLSRLFLDQLGEPPARYIRTARTEAAATLLTSTALPLTAVARRCGFRSTETLRQAFLAHYGTTPSAHRTALGPGTAHQAHSPNASR
ncbi:transcriptional regulator GlxA family with amidase domain [Kitasatospora sp. GP30]|uniref:GlxA family transcriptional regulator n=1 Tax=Kitasatospora sp. GP30 TaxID=3035084 RepID=UPI000C7122F8|nr:GlxA family transcriptional regulator [Kitasatospora sp. GP30]MDH6140403.1 transcriptional regulator GlxA family with amidase domain [Kitasatospora sp. GP30]